MNTYPAQFATPDASMTVQDVLYSNLCQIRQIGYHAATAAGEASITAWLLTNPAVVDRLCLASRLNGKGSVSAGVRQLVAHGKRLAENVPLETQSRDCA